MDAWDDTEHLVDDVVVADSDAIHRGRPLHLPVATMVPACGASEFGSLQCFGQPGGRTRPVTSCDQSSIRPYAYGRNCSASKRASSRHDAVISAST